MSYTREEMNEATAWFTAKLRQISDMFDQDGGEEGRYVVMNLAAQAYLMQTWEEDGGNTPMPDLIEELLVMLRTSLQSAHLEKILLPSSQVEPPCQDG